MADTKLKTEGILSRFDRSRENLIPVLQEIQRAFGYLSEEAMEQVADYLKVSGSIVFGVATFYSFFRLTPCGRNIVKVCCGTACHVRGGTHILRDIERRLDVKPGGTTADGEYSLETVACIGACALAPVVIVNDDVYGRMATSDTGKILGNAEV